MISSLVRFFSIFTARIISFNLIKGILNMLVSSLGKRFLANCWVNVLAPPLGFIVITPEIALPIAQALVIEMGGEPVVVEEEEVQGRVRRRAGGQVSRPRPDL